MKAIHKEFDEKNPETLLRREINPKASVPTDTKEPVIDFRSSDETVDRYSEIVVASGWQLANYQKNPVVQDAHNYYSVIDTIGKSIVTEVRGNHLFQRVLFAIDANPTAKIAYQLYKGGFLSAVSVGFIPKKWENGSREAGYVRKYLEQELLEVSAVGIPANPNALKLAFEEGAIEKSDLREFATLLKTLCNDDAGSRSNAGAPGTGANGARSKQIHKTFADIKALLR
ncbi:MAG: HK97 family phage prohead protease [Verrucomicrobiota bacterium]|nr:HK97 family phage prohead protease [Verrucomicrobiota bacterium]